MITETPVVELPRPLKHGEFYCHDCEEFVPTAKYEEHKKKHDVMARRGL